MKDTIKDWSASITGLDELGSDDTIALYSEMLATAHDVGYKVPDQELIETEDAEKLKKVIPTLHEGLVSFHAAAKAEAKEKAKAAAKAPKPVKKTAVKKTAETTAVKKTAETTAPTKPAKKARQKDAPPKETETMATAPAKKTAVKKAAKKAAPAKAAKGAKKAVGKKAASANARTPAAARNPFGEKAVIKVLTKENPARADSQRGQRIAVVLKYNNKKVADYYANEKPPFNRTDTLRYLIDNDHITIK